MVGRGDHEALAAAAIRLLEDAELAERLAANALAACRRYSWAAVRDEWLKLYFELADESAAHRPPVVPSRVGIE
jgi:phosphatidylinositol alpha-mannosyltransferase